MKLVTGASGMLGVALVNHLAEVGEAYLPLSSKDLDLRDYDATKQVFASHKPNTVFHLAAKVGGVRANMDAPGDFYRDNILINTSVMDACLLADTGKIVSVLSTCVYPDEKWVKYPLTEEQLHVGPPHDSNFGYAFSKRMLEVQSRAYRRQHGLKSVCVIPNNLFGEHDNFAEGQSHVIPALIRKVWEAKIRNQSSITVWGDGKPLREFTYSKDVAKILRVIELEYDDETPVNIGCTQERSIESIVKMICDLLEYDGKIVYDVSMPTGQNRKPSSNSLLLSSTSWKDVDYTPFEIALSNTCEWFRLQYPKVRGIE